MSQLRGPLQPAHGGESPVEIPLLTESAIYGWSQCRATPRRARTAHARTYREYAKADIPGHHPGRIASGKGTHGAHPRSVCRFPEGFEENCKNPPITCWSGKHTSIALCLMPSSDSAKHMALTRQS